VMVKRRVSRSLAVRTTSIFQIPEMGSRFVKNRAAIPALIGRNSHGEKRRRSVRRRMPSLHPLSSPRRTPGI
jgi:hypothetical protein